MYSNSSIIITNPPTSIAVRLVHGHGTDFIVNTETEPIPSLSSQHIHHCGTMAQILISNMVYGVSLHGNSRVTDPSFAATTELICQQYCYSFLSLHGKNIDSSVALGKTIVPDSSVTNLSTLKEGRDLHCHCSCTV